MAMQVSLVDGGVLWPTDVLTLRLDSNSAGISILDWVPKVGNDGDAYVDEVLTLLIAGSSHDDLASKVQALDNMVRLVEYARHHPQQRGIYLRCQLTNESGARQALVLAARRENGTALYGPPVSPGNIVESYKLVLRRTPWWEHLLGASTEKAALTTLIGGTHAVSSVPGDVPARIGIGLQFIGHVGGGGPITELWGGFRTARYGTVAKFVPVWELESGTNGTDATDSADVTASGGNCVTVSFATATMAARSVMTTVQAAGADNEHQRGRFLVLLRAKVGASTTVRVRLSSGMVGATTWTTLPRVQITGTDWFFYPLGEVTLPPSGWNDAEGITYAMYSSALRIEAERTSGSNSLYLDCLVLVPVDEGFFHVSGIDVDAAATDFALIVQEADGRILSLSNSGDVAAGTPDTSGTHPGSFFVPVGASNLILVGQRAASSVLADHFEVLVAYVPRWAMLRGAE
jgi:hypothetical protein